MESIMGFEKGMVSFRMFYAPDKLPDDHLARFQATKLPPLGTLAQESLEGWVGGRHLLDYDFDQHTAYPSGYLRLTLTRAEKKIPVSLLNAECRMEELARQRAEGLEFLSAPVRREIRQEVRERLLPTMPPQLKGLDMVYDPRTGILYSSACSEKQTELLQLVFLRTTGRALEPCDPLSVALREAKSDIRDWHPVSFALMANEEGVTCGAGRELLTWLWFLSETRGGEVELPGGERVALLIEGPLLLVNEGRGAHEAQLRKGDPVVGAETRASLQSGKMLKRARLTLAQGDECWSCVPDADGFVFRGMRLPPVESYDSHSRFAERMVHLDRFRCLFTGLYAEYIRHRKTPALWKPLVEDLRRWVVDRPGR